MAVPRHKEDMIVDGKVIAKKGTRMGVFPSDYGFPEHLSYEQYLALLEQEFKDQEAPDLEGVSFDDHEKFEEDVEADALIRAVVKKIDRGSKWGNIPGKMQEASAQPWVAKNSSGGPAQTGTPAAWPSASFLRPSASRRSSDGTSPARPKAARRSAASAATVVLPLACMRYRQHRKHW